MDANSLPPGFAEQLLTGQMPEATDDDTPQKSGIKRGVPAPDDARGALVKKWAKAITSAKSFHKKAFDAMKEDQAFASGEQWGAQSPDGKYVANIAQRHIQQRVSALYAKNPKAVCRRRDTLDFAIWDETPGMLKSAMIGVQQQQQTNPGSLPGPEFTSLMADVKQGTEKRAMMDKIAKTLQIVFKHEFDEQIPPAKTQMKGMVGRALVNGVGFIKLGYQRLFDKRPDDVQKVGDITEQISTLERLMADAIDGEKDKYSAEIEQLNLLKAEMDEVEDVIVREGMVLDFPDSDSIIIDPRCTRLSGFIGAQWVAQEFLLSVDDIKEIYHIDLQKGDFTSYDEKGGSGDMRMESQDKSRCCVWEIYSKSDGLLYVVADGVKDFLKEPEEPPVKLERFWPWFSLAFNALENKKKIYPLSDISLLRPMQKDYNEWRQSLREHRRANRPKLVVTKGALDDEDLESLKNHPANAVIQLNGLGPNQKVEEVIQPMKQTGIDPGLYEVDSTFTDLQRVVGTSAENLGGGSNNTATSSSIAEGSRMSAMSSNVDDLDDMLCELCRAAGSMLLLEMDPETVSRIVGVGAVWPTLSANEVSQELMLEIEAGSSGRPNKAVEMDNFTKIAPFLLQIPGIDPAWMARQAVQRLDDRLDVTDALNGAMQSMVAQNAQKQLATADPTQNPAMQGDAGAANGPQAPAAKAPPQLGPPQGTPGM